MQKTIEAAAAKFTGDIVELVKANMRARIEGAFGPPGVYYPNKDGSVTSWTIRAAAPTPEAMASAKTATHIQKVEATTFVHPVAKPKTILPPKPRVDQRMAISRSLRTAGKAGAKASDIARDVGMRQDRVSSVLVSMLKNGAVKRIGRTRGTRWVAVGVK